MKKQFDLNNNISIGKLSFQNISHQDNFVADAFVLPT